MHAGPVIIVAFSRDHSIIVVPLDMKNLSQFVMVFQNSN